MQKKINVKQEDFSQNRFKDISNQKLGYVSGFVNYTG